MVCINYIFGKLKVSFFDSIFLNHQVTLQILILLLFFLNKLLICEKILFIKYFLKFTLH